MNAPTEQPYSCGACGYTCMAIIGALLALGTVTAVLQHHLPTSRATSTPVAAHTALQATTLAPLDHDPAEAVAQAYRAGYQDAIARERCANGGIPGLGMPIDIGTRP